MIQRFPRFPSRPVQTLLATLVAGVLWTALPAEAIRIKEVAAVQGVRTNQLTGYGLVIGLDGTGDQSSQMPYTAQSMSNYLQQLGIVLPPAAMGQLQLKNVAAVIVTAQLPAFAQPGQAIDVNVSSIGNSKSLKGGTLNAENGLTRFAVRYMCTHHYFSIEKAKRELGYQPKVTIAEGIRLTTAHLKANGWS